MKDTNWIYRFHVYCQKAIWSISKKFPLTWCVLIYEFVRFFFWRIPLLVVGGVLLSFLMILCPIDALYNHLVFVPYTPDVYYNAVFQISVFAGVIGIAFWWAFLFLLGIVLWTTFQVLINSDDPKKCSKIEITKSNQK